ncbi:AfsA-related hotdog domain-containing protein [Streptomyces sp. NPDC002851]
MSGTALAEGRAASDGGRRLIHRPRAWEHSALAVLPDVEEEFVLSGGLPRAHPLLCDGPGLFHDLQSAAGMLREVSELIGRSHFGVPGHRTGVFYRFAVDTGDIGAWRTGAGPGQLTSTLRVRPDKVIDAVPRALEFRTELTLDGVPCGTGSANVVFLPPMVLRGHREHGRASAVSAGSAGSAGSGGSAVFAGSDGSAGSAVFAGSAGSRAGQRPEHGGAPVPPAEVGRTTPATVLLHDPSPVANGRLSVAVSVPEHWPLGGGSNHLSALVQLETLRQTSLLAAGRARGLAPARSTLGSLQVHFRGYAEPDLPLRCAAVAGQAGTDGHGRRRVPVTLTIAQSGRAVLEAVTTVVEDH